MSLNPLDLLRAELTQLRTTLNRVAQENDELRRRVMITGQFLTALLSGHPAGEDGTIEAQVTSDQLEAAFKACCFRFALEPVPEGNNRFGMKVRTVPLTAEERKRLEDGGKGGPKIEIARG